MQFAHIGYHMTLDEYLTQQGVSGPQFAARIGVDPATVYRIRKGQVLPHRRTIHAIVQETAAQVTVNDLVCIEWEEVEGNCQTGVNMSKGVK